MATLYDITGRMLELLAIADDEDIEPEVLKDTLESIEGEYDDKIEAYCKAIKNMESDAKAFDEEAKRMKAKATKLDNNVKRMKATIMESLKVMNRTSAGGKILKANIRKNGGVLPLIVDGEAKDLPFEYQKTTIEPDNTAIREALDKGIELDFARYGERGESINIK